MSSNFFDAETYPQLMFTSDLIRLDGSSVILDGQLTIRDQTHPITARGTLGEPVTALDGAVRVGMALKTVIDRTDYGVSWNVPLPKGGTVLGNDVTITINLDLSLDADAAPRA